VVRQLRKVVTVMGRSNASVCPQRSAVVVGIESKNTRQKATLFKAKPDTIG
jgi:hypothetical protein